MDPHLTPHPLDDEAPASIVINPHSALGKELRKWEQHRTELVPRGSNPGNPYVFRPYPRMLYRAQALPNGKTACMMPQPSPYEYQSASEYERACLLKESFDRLCQRIVPDEGAERIAVGQGWSLTAPDALARAEQEARAIGQAAAEAAYAASRMSDKAKAELSAADQTTHEHVTDVVGIKKGRRGRKRVIAASGEVPA